MFSASLVVVLWWWVLLAAAAESSGKIPTWSAPVPTAELSHGGLPVLSSVKHYTVFNSTLHSVNGTYNHGPMMIYWHGTYYVSWYNAPTDESSDMRVLLASSKDAIGWSAPTEVFPALNAHGEENVPFALVNDHLYVAASDVNWNNTHDSGNRGWLLLRQVFSPAKFGSPFWLNDVIPSSMKVWGYPTFHSMDRQTLDDMTFYRSTQLNETVPRVHGVHFGERSLYEATPGSYEYVLLLRDGRSGYVWSSTCSLTGPLRYPQLSQVSFSTCRSGTGAFLFGQPNSLIDPFSLTNASCLWSAPVQTSIEDSPSRTCAAPLPDELGTYLVGNQCHTCGRDLLVLSIARDGYDFSLAWAVRDNPPPVHFPGNAKNPGFQYPSGMWIGKYLYVLYSIGKEDIALSRILLDELKDKC